MPTYPVRLALRTPLVVFVLLLAGCGSLFSQELSLAPSSSPQADQVVAVSLASIEPLPNAPAEGAASTGALVPSPGSMAVVATSPLVAPPRELAAHQFWDRENRVLFTAVGALAAADFCTTRANLASGGKELNPVTRVFSGSTPGLATNFALETASTIGISYIFHKTGHHKLERMTSFVNIGTSAGAVAYGLTHR